MIVSTKGRYALRVMLCFAQRGGEEYIPIKEIAEKEGISLKYLESIMTVLSKGGLVDAVHGKGGGYRLNRRPEDYTVGSILKLTEGGLTAVPRTLDLYEGDTQAEALVRALRQGSWNKDWRSALPDWFSIQSVWLDDGVCYVNLLSSAVPEDADREEADLALRALQDSLSSLDSVQEVRILVNGEPAQDYAGVSLRISARPTR